MTENTFEPKEVLNLASVKRLCRICLLLQSLSKLYIKVRDLSGGRSLAITDVDQTRAQHTMRLYPLWMGDIPTMLKV
jgi:hypothetical protein